MKYEGLFSLETLKKYSRLSRAAVVIGVRRVKGKRLLLACQHVKLWGP